MRKKNNKWQFLSQTEETSDASQCSSLETRISPNEENELNYTSEICIKDNTQTFVSVESKNPKCKSQKEVRLQFKDDNCIEEIFYFKDPSVSRDLSPPPLNIMPKKSCLKQRSTATPFTESLSSISLLSSTNPLQISSRLNNQIKSLNIDEQKQNVLPNIKENSIMAQQCSIRQIGISPIFWKAKEKNNLKNDAEIINRDINEKFPSRSFSGTFQNVSVSRNDNLNSRNISEAASSADIRTQKEIPNVNYCHPNSERSVNDQNNNSDNTRNRSDTGDIKNVQKIPATTMWNRNLPQNYIEPQLIDYWDNTSYKRRNRRVTHIKEIIAMNTRPSRNNEVIKSEVSTFTVVELCRDHNYGYARCFTIADIKVSLLVVPFSRFPTDKTPPLGSKWRATLELVRLSITYRKDIYIARVDARSSLDRAGIMEQKINRRVISFGAYGSSFYSEMLQLYLPLNHTKTRETGESLFSPFFGDIEFNGRILPPIPQGMVMVEGNGWVEPLPGNSGIMRDDGPTAWLLAEPFIGYKNHDIHSFNKFKQDPEEEAASQKKWEIKNKKIVAEMLEKRAKGYTMYPRDNTLQSKKKCVAHTKDGAFDKKERRAFCERLIKSVIERGTSTTVFQSKEEVFDLVTIREGRGTRLGKLGELVVGYLKDEELFANLKENEPENLEDLRQIIKWSVDYAKAGRDILDTKLYTFVFPLKEDTYIELEE